MELKGDIEHNKKLWTLISGTNFPLSGELVSLTLEKSRKHLFNGINHYKTPSTQSEAELKKHTGQSIFDLVLTLSKMMNLDALQAWDLFCYYLTEEFRGSEDDLLKFTSNEKKKSQLLIDIWLFYRSERVFLLQCIKLIVSYWNDADHPYHENYEAFLSSFDKNEVKKSLISQLVSVINEVPPSKGQHGNFVTGNVVKRWVYSNLREQLELTQILAICMNSYGLSCNDFLSLLKIFQSHSFGYDIANITPTDEMHLETARMISYSINILLLGAMDFSSILKNPESPGLTFWKDEAVLKQIDEIICQLRVSEQYAPLFLGWMLVVYLNPNEVQNTRYQKLGEQALQLRVFSYLEKMLNHTLFKEDTVFSTIAFSTVYQLISLLVNTFDKDNLGNTSDVLSLVALLLSNSKMANCFWEDGMEEGVGALYCLAREMFPLQFGPLVKMAQGLVSSSPSSCKRVLSDLKLLRLFAEPLDNSVATYLGADEDTAIWALNQNRQPLKHCRIILLAGTKGYALKGPPPTIHWECSYSIWDVLYNTLKELLNQVSLGSTNVEPSTVERGVATLKFLNKILEAEYILDEDMDSTVELVFYLVDKFSQVPNGPVSVLACCMDIFATLILTYFEDVSMKLKKTGFLPHVKNVKLDFISYINGDSFDVGILGFQLAREECVTGHFDLLKAYLQFLENIVEHSEMDPTILFGGLIFVIREVFPCYLSWHYQNPLDSNFIGRKCLLIFHKILTVDLASLESENNLMNTVRKMCVYSLLNCDSGLTLLRIVATGDQFIQSLMEQQTSWISGQGVEFINMVQLSLSVLNRVFMLKAAVQDKKDHSLIELEIYGPPSWNNGLKLVLVVAYYIYHRFNPTLPTLAVKLLKRFAKEFPVSLLACFGMEGDVVRDTFLRRLESKVEVVDLKVAILEFITACIEKQPGLTEVFVNIQHTSSFKRYRTDEEKKSGPQGGCLNFVCSILKATQKDEQRLKGPLYNSSIDLIHALWIAQKETIITYLGSKDDFWNDLLLPLFLPPCSNSRACALIFNILSLELFMKGALISKNLEGLLKKFFSEEESHFLDWSKFIVSSLDKEITQGRKASEVSNEITILTSWKNFITIVLNQSFSLSKQQIESTYQVIVGTLFTLLDQMSDMKAIVLLSEFYLLILKTFKEKCFCSKRTAVEDLSNLLYRVSTAYEQLHPRAQDAVLATAMISLDFLSEEIVKDEASLESLILAISNAISVESLSVLKEAADGKVSRTSHSAAASVTLLHKLLKIVKSNNNWVGVFKSTKIDNQLLISTSYCLQTQSNYKFVSSVFHLFCFLVDTPVGKSLVMQNIGSYLWLPLMTCKENAQEDKSQWSKIYNLGIKLCAWFLHVHQNTFMNSAFDFILFNHNHLMSSLGMLRFNQYEETLDTVYETLCLLNELAKFYHIHLTEKQTLKSLIKGLIVTLHASIIALQDPKGLKTTELVVYDSDAEVKHSSERELSTEQVKTIHRLFEIKSLCLHTLMRMTPSLEYLLTDSEDNLSSWEPVVDLTGEKTFSNSLISVPNLTYGTLLSSASIYCDEISKQEKLLTKSSSDLAHYDVVCFGFELLISFLLSQAAVIAANLNLTCVERSHLRQELAREILEHVHAAQKCVHEKSRGSGSVTPGKERTPVGPPKPFVARRLLSSGAEKTQPSSPSQDKSSPMFSTPKQRTQPESSGLQSSAGVPRAPGSSEISVELPDLEFYSFITHVLKSFR
ncbi:nucleoporin Nup188 [Ischnura elegans]|uniref:nucleoporin Nup188 n=1 Tax=Ischnura elegans TaxID=197161 RepID=UPI001ED8B582|nr:nucleoporin Nup188 [Ischnura elegans]